MKRREFLAASLATSAAALAGKASAQSAPTGKREFYQVRRYQLQAGPQVSLTEHYLNDALIPALARRNMGPVGAFKVDLGPETPVFYVVIPSASVEPLVTIDLDLAHDDEFQKAAEPLWNAPAAAPPFVTLESWLLEAFEGWPRVTPPPATGDRAKRVYQLRTYESPSYRDHIRKVEMFHSGEFNIFKSSGFDNVFFGDTLIGSHMPSLTYMVSYGSLADLESHWQAFFNNPDWKKLSTNPHFVFEPIVKNVTNLILRALPSSQI